MSKGTFIVLIGPDGTGKSTIAAHLKNTIGQSHSQTHSFHWRPGLLPQLGKNNKKDGPISTDTSFSPPMEFTYGYTISAIRYLYYLADFILGYWIIIMPRLIKGQLIIGERWYYDIIVHPQRYAFRLPIWIMRLGGLLVPKPDRIILLYGDPKIIHKRKPELEVTEIERHIKELEELSPNDWRSIAISTDTTIDSTIQQLEYKLKHCTKKLREYWTTYPTKKSARIYIGHNDTVANALKLAQAYTSKSKLLKKIFTLLPEVISRAILSKVYDNRMTDTLNVLDEHVRYNLSLNHANISAYIGSNNSNQKITLQISKDMQVVAYAKCGGSPLAISSLNNEKMALTEINLTKISKVITPQIIDCSTTANYHMVIESPMPLDHMQRSDELNDLDINFITHLSVTNNVIVTSYNYLNGTALDNIQQNCNNGTNHNSVINDAVTSITNIFEKCNIIRMTAHGDYAPWNTIKINNNCLYVFDWEYYSNNYPALFDLNHFIYMTSRLIKKYCAKDTSDSLINSYSNTSISDYCTNLEINKEIFIGYILLYLLIQYSRENSEHEGTPDFTIACIESTLTQVKL